MQQWEYLELKIMRLGTWRTKTKDEPEGEVIEMTRLIEVLNYLGEQGWELVFFVSGVWYFKRPLIQDDYPNTPNFGVN